MNSFDALLDTVPAYAKDLKLNFSSIVQQQTELNEQQTWGAVVASAIASRNQQMIVAALEDAGAHLSPEALEAAKAAAAIMGMNNIYYRFVHMAANAKYQTMRAGLRMNVMRTHGIDPLDFELWSTAVSAINGCGACIESHEKTLRDKGVSEEKILAAVRIAAVVHGLAVVMDTESVAAALPVVA